ncbi:MAG TPA: hypothetical protein VKR32_13600 [Puia sp.]|nr:hypothetical protein [Puia sp.]
MKNNSEMIDLIKRQGVLPLYYHDSPVISLNVLKAIHQSGIHAVEYTNRGTYAVENLIVLLKAAEKEMPGMQVGVGTIRSVADAEIFIAAGAKFLVCPLVDPSIGAVARNAGLLWVPGCMTPTEINAAASHGAGLVKIFPGNLLGPSYLKAVREIFPEIEFMPTGGVELSKDSISSWFAAGAVAVGMGSKLLESSLIQAGNYQQLTQNCLACLTFVESARRTGLIA